LGHKEGDARSSRRPVFYKRRFRDADLARVWRDEFVVFLTKAWGSNVAALKQRLQDASKHGTTRNAKLPSLHECRVAGTTNFTKTGQAAELLREADERMYEQPSERKNAGALLPRIGNSSPCKDDAALRFPPSTKPELFYGATMITNR